MESKSDMLLRVCMMAEGDATWDLSDNDTRALRHVLTERNEYKQESEWSSLRIRDLEAQLAEARKDGARLDHVIDNFDEIYYEAWEMFFDYEAADATKDGHEIEHRKAWRKYLDAAMEGGEE